MVKSGNPNEKIPQEKTNKSTKNKKTSKRKRTRSQSSKISHQPSSTSSNSENSSSDSETESQSHNLYPKEIINQPTSNQQSPPDLQPQNNEHQQYRDWEQAQNNHYQQNYYPWHQQAQNNSFVQWAPSQNPYFLQNNLRNNRQFNTGPPKRPQSSYHAHCLLHGLLQKQYEKNRIEHPTLNQDDFVFNFKNNFGRIFIDPETNITHVQLFRTYCFFTVEEQTRLEQYYATNLTKNHTDTHDYANPAKDKLFRCPTPICNYSIINTSNTTKNILEHCKLFHQQNPLTYRYRDNEDYIFVEYKPPE